MNTPYGVNATWNTSVLLPGLLMAPITLLWGPLLSYNLLVVMSFALSAAGTYPLLRSWRAGRLPAACGALLWAFCPAVLAGQVGHLSLVLLGLVPLILLATANVVGGQGSATRAGALLGLLCALQLLTGEEVLFETVLFALLTLLALASMCRAAALLAVRRVATGSASALLVFLLVAGFPLGVQIFGPLHQHGSPFLVGYFGADPRELVTPSTRTAISGAAPSMFAATYAGGLPEYMSYLGLPLLLAVAIVAVRRRRDVRIRALLVVVVVLEGLSLGSHLVLDGHDTTFALPWAALAQLPVLEAALPNRLALLADLAVIAIAVLGLPRLSTSGVRVRVGVTSLVVGCLVSLWPAAFTTEATAPVPAFFRLDPSGGCGRTAVLVLPYPTATDTDAMRWQSATGMSFDMPGGFFIGPASDGHAFVDGPGPLATARTLLTAAEKDRVPLVDEAVRAQFRADIGTWRVSAVVLGPSPHAAVLAATVTALTGRGPTSTSGVDLWPIDTPTICRS